MDNDFLWLAVGFLGQGMFMMRFVVQWLRSERERKSVVPVAFWYFSLLGGVILLVYAVHRRDPVFVAGQGLGLLIYLRNLQLIRAAGAAAARHAAPEGAAGQAMPGAAPAETTRDRTPDAA